MPAADDCYEQIILCTHHYCTPHEDPGQAVACACASLKVAFKVTRILQAIMHISLDSNDLVTMQARI